MRLALSKIGETDLRSRSVVPEALHIPNEFATTADELKALEPVISLRRIRSKNSSAIFLSVDIPGTDCIEGGSYFAISIDGRDGGTMCDGDIYLVTLSEEEFAKLRNGAEIALRRGPRRSPDFFRVVGTLKKDSLIEDKVKPR